MDNYEALLENERQRELEKTGFETLVDEEDHCKVHDCFEPVVSDGLCANHYQEEIEAQKQDYGEERR